MRLLIGICVALYVGTMPAAAEPPVPAKKRAGKKTPAKKKSADEKAKAAARKALLRKLATDNGVLRQLEMGSSPFGAGLQGFSGAGIGGLGGVNFRTADAAYERGDWAKARALYHAGDVMADRNSRYGASRSTRRYGHACQALGKTQCALEVEDALHRAASQGLGGMGSLGMSRRPDRSRASRAMGELVSKRRRAQKAIEQGKTAEADELLAAVFTRDPRCPGRTCPPFTLREMSGVHARRGEFDSAKVLLNAYLDAMPKHPERWALKRQMKTWTKAAKQAKVAEATALEANRVRIPKPGKAAPWFKTAKSTPRPRFGAVKYGGRVGVALMRIGKAYRWMGVRRGSAMIDGLAMPTSTEWVGVGGDETIYYATEAGALFRAGLDAARSPFTPMGTAPGATQWDVQGSTVVASDDTHVWVWAKGATTPHAYTHPEPIGSAWTRADGVVVFGDAQAAYVSADGGRTWTRTALGNMRGLHRHGQQISQKPNAPISGEKSFGGSRPPRCAQGELTVDLKWVVPSDDSWWHGKGWDSIFSVGPNARTPRSLPDGSGQNAASGGADVVAEIAKCRADREAYFSGRGGAGGIASGGGRCTGLGCIETPPAPPTPVRFGLLGDGDCAGENEAPVVMPEVPEQRSFSRRGPTMCTGLTRAGTLVRVTQTTLDAVPPIANCAPEKVASLAGIGVVSCVEAGGARALVVLDGEGKARERLSVAGRPGHIGIASDGTIAVALHGQGATRGAVRRSVDLGAPSAWRIDTVPDAQVWRPAPGGHGIALAPGSRGEAVFPDPRIQRKRVDGKRDYKRWSGQRLAAIKACHAEAYAADPSLTGRLFFTLTIDAAGTLTSLATDNRLQGQSEGLLACMTGVLEGDVHPRIAATETAYLTLESKNNSLRAWLTAPGQPAKALTEDVLFERPPRQISARDDGSIAVDPSAYPPKTCTLPKAGAFLCPKKR